MALSTFAASAFALEEERQTEAELWARRDAGDRGAYRELAHRYAPFAREVLRCFVRDRRVPPRIEFDELLSAANVGLMHAIARYDQASGFAFTTFASRRIRGAVMDEIRGRNDLPRSLHESLRRAQRRFDADPTEEAHRELHRLEEQARAASPGSIDDSAGSVGAHLGRSTETADQVTQGTRLEAVERVLARCSVKERRLLELLYLEDIPIGEAAEQLGYIPGHVAVLARSLIARLRRELGVEP